MTKHQTISLKQIHNKFDVRVQLDQDRVLQFAGMYEAGIDLPPIEVVKIEDDEYAFVDGRHRAAAREYLNLQDIDCIVRNGELRDNPIALFAHALFANWGGAKPPSRADIVHTVVRMMEAGGTQREIREKLNFLPAGSFRAYAADAQAIIARRKTGRALDMVAEGATAETAAKLAGMKVEKLQDIIAGKKGSWGGNRTEEDVYLSSIKSFMSTTFTLSNRRVGGKLMDLIKRVDDGDISAKGAAGVIKHYEKYLRHTGILLEDWRSRLQSVVESQDTATGNQVEQAMAVAAANNSITLTQKEIKSSVNVESHPKKHPQRPTSQEFARMPSGFWDENLPKAIKSSGETTARPLIEWFQKNKNITFTFKQVDGALQRLRRRGVKV